MGVIREVLILEDQFSSTMASFISETQRAASAVTSLRGATAAVDAAALHASGSVGGAGDEVENLDRASRKAASSTDELTRKIKNLVGTYVGLKGLQSLLSLSDEMASTTARLDMMNDGLQTTAELNQMIFDSAQRSRGAYQDTADMVAKLGNLAGDAFGSTAEIVAFAEQINKQMTLSGASNTAKDAAMLQLTQAMSSGVLRGEELNSILEQTPTIAKTIAEYLGVTTGEMRELASEGAITAEVVKNAMFAAADETNAKFAEMPMTWGQVWTQMQNTALMAIQPILSALNWLANNLDVVAPIVVTLGAAFVVFLVAANWIKITTAATTFLTTAQKMLTAAMATGWAIPLIAIVAVIGALYLIVAVYNRITGESVSATGIIAGVFLSLAAFIANNTVVPLVNAFSTFGNFIGNVFNNPIGAVKVLFYDLAVTVLGYISNIAQGIENLVNAIPGVQVDLTSGINGLYNAAKSASDAAKAEAGWVEYFPMMENFDLKDAYNAGYNWGSNLFSGGTGTSPTDFLYEPPTYDQVQEIGGGVGSIAKSIDATQEDIKSLVDVAERRYVNQINLTAQTPVINVNGQNTGRTAADRQNLANAIRDVLLEQMSSGSSRSTAVAHR